MSRLVSGDREGNRTGSAVFSMIAMSVPRMLVDNRFLLEEMSAHLLKHEVLDGEIEGIFDAEYHGRILEDRPTAEWVPTPLEDSG